MLLTNDSFLNVKRFLVVFQGLMIVALSIIDGTDITVSGSCNLIILSILCQGLAQSTLIIGKCFGVVGKIFANHQTGFVLPFHVQCVEISTQLHIIGSGVILVNCEEIKVVIGFSLLEKY